MSCSGDETAAIGQGPSLLVHKGKVLRGVGGLVRIWLQMHSITPALSAHSELKVLINSRHAHGAYTSEIHRFHWTYLLEQIELDDPAYATIFISSLLELRYDGLLKNLPWLRFRAMPTKIVTPHWKGNNYGVIIHLSQLALALMIYGWSSIRRHRDPSPS
ncbi:hypothetical protein CISG_04846 [Coccidioides immitis RMSCC 3703]|uniref:Uncharacterized protein n=1 Tax=Coccidioides immitis RMSCC 3703 TaxID=454286 RepID=A0A0J8TPN4_COCIT|nr:hypothetical protein CISG_04846 [Coccidioides immitis RMSCC 3703]